jgi:bacterioferritin-associated ferredoxin
MLPDDELCLCFHVSRRKVVNFIRVERPARPGQLSECFGAGTGCGWCRPFLQRLYNEAVVRGETVRDRLDPSSAMQSGDEPSAAEYARLRSAYVRGGGGTPPAGATPINEPE